MSKMTREEAIERFNGLIESFKSAADKLYKDSLPGGKQGGGNAQRLYSNFETGASEEDREMMQQLLPNAWMLMPDFREEKTYPYLELEGYETHFNPNQVQNFSDALYADMYNLFDEQESFHNVLAPADLVNGYAQDGTELIENSIVAGVMFSMCDWFRKNYYPQAQGAGIDGPFAMDESYYTTAVAKKDICDHAKYRDTEKYSDHYWNSVKLLTEYQEILQDKITGDSSKLADRKHTVVTEALSKLRDGKGVDALSNASEYLSNNRETLEKSQSIEEGNLFQKVCAELYYGIKKAISVLSGGAVRAGTTGKQLLDNIEQNTPRPGRGPG